MFEDRSDAGRRLGARLAGLATRPVVVLGLPRGGVVVAAEVAKAIGAPLDVVLVRKLGVPFQPELAMGAIGEDGVRVIDDEVVRAAGVSEREIETVERVERAELARRAARFRGDRLPVPLEGRTAVVVDDGVATGSTARAACRVARARGASRVVLAVPVAPPDWAARMGSDADELIALSTPRPFFAIGQFYEDFSQTGDDVVAALLEEAANPVARQGDPLDDPPVAPAPVDEELEVVAGPVTLSGHLTVPDSALGLVVFSHGSGSSRHSPRNRYVASLLNGAGLATLLFDLLTPEEERDRANVFDIGLLAGRLGDVTGWIRGGGGLAGLPVGYFGASTGAAAALWAAAEPGADVAAVVSRGGRPDLAAARLGGVAAPTLFIVGGLDRVVLDLNRHARAMMRCETRLVVVRGATHLFEEPGTLRSAAALSRDWFVGHMAGRGGERLLAGGGFQLSTR